MTDHIAAVRAQAEKEAERIWPKYPNGEAARIIDTECWVKRKAYVRGQVDLASLLTREKIAEVIHRSVYKTLDIEDLTDENYLELFDQADAVLALLVGDTQS